MRRFLKHLRIGLRWIRSGWLLFLHNPWLLGGMGLSIAVLVGLLALVPLIGGLLIALSVPILLTSTYLSIDGVYRQKGVFPSDLRLPALKRSPLKLLEVFRDEARLIPTMVICIYSTAAALLINILMQLLAGSAWVANWSSLNYASLATVLAATLFAFVLYVVLAASLVYMLPLTFLKDEPLIPSMWQSLKASWRFIFALLVLLGLLLVPLLFGTAASYLSVWLSYVVWLVLGAIVLPVVTASLYCSYRDIFAAKETPI